jgi:hypothetical protein
MTRSDRGCRLDPWPRRPTASPPPSPRSPFALSGSAPATAPAHSRRPAHDSPHFTVFRPTDGRCMSSRSSRGAALDHAARCAPFASLPAGTTDRMPDAATARQARTLAPLQVLSFAGEQSVNRLGQGARRTLPPPRGALASGGDRVGDQRACSRRRRSAALRRRRW